MNTQRCVPDRESDGIYGILRGRQTFTFLMETNGFAGCDVITDLTFISCQFQILLLCNRD